ncbi:hypothetical protein [Micromonospora ureilytica]
MLQARGETSLARPRSARRRAAGGRLVAARRSAGEHRDREEQECA